MRTQIINVVIVLLLIVGVGVWMFNTFQQEALIEDKIERIEVYRTGASAAFQTITDKDKVENILECMNKTCAREEMSEEASYAAVDGNLILFGATDKYEVGIYQGSGTVGFVYNNTIIDSEFEPFLF
ncbi:hypothetical protein SAMN05421503_2605 [Terribacillus aidingensis]|uniref:Uncharacterized protein n=1 Tax=Terribacillus aidingensis TaxID=586416 RepID=A0A285P594_9BACI|nr:hypothetical protein [Terribacillus aidingensis]SNZ15326.1 hypothetical protein SAMN05421503_2605 [Terribacillus aidingensis]